jgi:hypothetical protein
VSDTIEVGQTIEWGLRVYSSAGVLADAGTLPVATVTLPDGTTTAATVTRVSAGVYIASYVATVVGTHRVRWTSSGANSGDFPHTDFATVESRLAPLVTVEDLQLHMQMTVPADAWGSAQAACDAAATMVRACCRSDMSDWTGWKLGTAKGIATGVAADIFGNPRDVSSFSGPESLNYAATPRTRRTLFPSEESALRGLCLPGFA